MKKMFYVSDQRSAERATQSQMHRHGDTFSGVDVLDGTVKSYTGVVVSMEDAGESAPEGHRWRIGVDEV